MMETILANHGTMASDHGVTVMFWLVQGGTPPPVISWFIIPINYRYNPHKP